MKDQNSDSYLEQCIRALPLEKQAAARKAFEELGEGDLGALSRVLIALEATTALAKEVPRDLAEVARRLLDDLDVRRKQAEQAAAELRWTPIVGQWDRKIKLYKWEGVEGEGRSSSPPSCLWSL